MGADASSAPPLEAGRVSACGGETAAARFQSHVESEGKGSGGPRASPCGSITKHRCPTFSIFERKPYPQVAIASTDRTIA